MSCVFLIMILFSPNSLLESWAKSTTTAVLQAQSKSNSTSSKRTSYFYYEPQGPQTYEFGYFLDDKSTENFQFRNETKTSNDTVTGSYGYLRPDGILTIVNYKADKNGYRIINGRSDKVYHLDNSSTIQSKDTVTSTSTSTESSGLNLTAVAATLPPILVNEVMDKFHIDLSPDASPADILHPNISDIINGVTPLMDGKSNSSLDVKVVQNFIPSNFPISPFLLPSEIYNKSKDD